MREITVAHSPDADDIFMYYAIKFGWVRHEDSFNNIALDIETLNVEALKGTYEISAISFGMYPLIKDDYALLRTAVSFGEGYGPKLVKKKNTTLKRDFSVALSGKYTTNALLFKIKYPDAKIKYYNFLEIEDAVLNGEVDAGVLIHESILTYHNSLNVEAELWNIWQELAGENLPLPLGGMAIRRTIPLHRSNQYELTLTKAVDVGNKNKRVLSNMLNERNLIRVNDEKLQKYLSLYANDNSVTLNKLQIKALNRLYKLGYEAGYYDEPIDINNYFLPSEYNEQRFS